MPHLPTGRVPNLGFSDLAGDNHVYPLALFRGKWLNPWELEFARDTTPERLAQVERPVILFNNLVKRTTGGTEAGD